MGLGGYRPVRGVLEIFKRHCAALATLHSSYDLDYADHKRHTLGELHKLSNGTMFNLDLSHKPMLKIQDVIIDRVDFRSALENYCIYCFQNLYQGFFSLFSLSRLVRISMIFVLKSAAA